MNKKYEMLPPDIKGFHRIKALIDFGGIKEGELGGYIEKEGNLSQSGDTWVYGNAKVYGNAWVSGNAKVSGNAWVSGNAKVSGDAEVSGNAWVSGNAEVSGNAWVSGNAEVCATCTKNPVNITGLYYNLTVTDNHLKAGCQLHQIQDWLIKTDRELIQVGGKQAVKFYHETLKPLILALNLK